MDSRPPRPPYPILRPLHTKIRSSGGQLPFRAERQLTHLLPHRPFLCLRGAPSRPQRTGEAIQLASLPTLPLNPTTNPRPSRMPHFLPHPYTIPATARNSALIDFLPSRVTIQTPSRQHLRFLLTAPRNERIPCPPAHSLHLRTSLIATSTFRSRMGLHTIKTTSSMMS